MNRALYDHFYGLAHRLPLADRGWNSSTTTAEKQSISDVLVWGKARCKVLIFMQFKHWNYFYFQCFFNIHDTIQLLVDAYENRPLSPANFSQIVFDGVVAPEIKTDRGANNAKDSRWRCAAPEPPVAIIIKLRQSFLMITVSCQEQQQKTIIYCKFLNANLWKSCGKVHFLTRSNSVLFPTLLRAKLRINIDSNKN